MLRERERETKDNVIYYSKHGKCVKVQV